MYFYPNFLKDSLMKILNITTMIDWRGGDAQMYSVYNLLKEYTDLNQFILCPSESVLAKKCKENKDKYYTYKKTSKVFSVIKSIISVCKTEKIEVIHVHDSDSLTATLLASFFLPNNIKIILSRKRNNKIKDKFLNRLKYSNSRIFKIISVSKAVESIFENIVEDKNKLVTIYDAIDVTFFERNKSKGIIHKEFSIPVETKIIGNVAALSNQKDIYTFIDTAKKIKNKIENNIQVKFVIIGEGSQKNELEKYASENELQNDLIFMNFRNNVHELLPEFDVFLLTSLTEGLPLTIYEAFAAKVPVVSTNAGGIAEVVQNEITGFISDLKDSESLSNNVLKIINNNKLSETITTNAYNLVKKNHDLNIMKENYYNFYKNINN